jgi:hypothetical protein
MNQSYFGCHASISDILLVLVEPCNLSYDKSHENMLESKTKLCQKPHLKEFVGVAVSDDLLSSSACKKTQTVENNFKLRHD